MILEGLVIDRTEFTPSHRTITVRLIQGNNRVADITLKEDKDEFFDFGTRLVVMLQENA